MTKRYNPKVGDLLKVVLYGKTYIGFVFNDTQSIWYKINDKEYKFIMNTKDVLHYHTGIILISR